MCLCCPCFPWCFFFVICFFKIFFYFLKICFYFQVWFAKRLSNSRFRSHSPFYIIKINLSYLNHLLILLALTETFFFYVLFPFRVWLSTISYPTSFSITQITHFIDLILFFNSFIYLLSRYKENIYIVDLIIAKYILCKIHLQSWLPFWQVISLYVS